MERPRIPEWEVKKVQELVQVHLGEKILEKGRGAFVSTNEILGAVTEEYHESRVEIQANHRKNLEKELLDLAVACLWGVASLRHIPKE